MEHLQLLPEETLYLVEHQGLDCLEPHSEAPLSKDHLGGILFPTSLGRAQYAMYAYLRGQGWVPKSGVKFGVDYCKCALKINASPEDLSKF
jgi:tRNA-splicing endonuclease subunit Sen2